MTKGTYISTELSDLGNRYVLTLLEDSDIENHLTSGKFHITLIYAPNDKLPYGKEHKTFMATVTGYDVLGEGKWQGLVLKLSCPEAEKFHEDILEEYGNVHSYPEFNCHMTVKYRPESGDLDKLKKTIRVGTRISFTGINSVPLEP